MIQIEFSSEAIEQLRYERYHHPHPQVQRKMDVLYLKSKGLAHKEICRLCEISRMTLTTYLKQYKGGGIERLKPLNYQGQPSELNAHASNLNLIERLWRFVHNECLYSNYYEDFESFKAAIAGCLEKANTDHKEKLKRLLSQNFQSFKNVDFLAV